MGWSIQNPMYVYNHSLEFKIFRPLAMVKMAYLCINKTIIARLKARIPIARSFNIWFFGSFRRHMAPPLPHASGRFNDPPGGP